MSDDKKATWVISDVQSIGGAISARDFDDESEEPRRVIGLAIARIAWADETHTEVEHALVCLGEFGVLTPLTERAPWQREPKAPTDAS